MGDIFSVLPFAATKCQKYAGSIANRRYILVTRAKHQKQYVTSVPIVSNIQLQFRSHAAPQCIRAGAVELELLQQYSYIVRVSSELT